MTPEETAAARLLVRIALAEDGSARDATSDALGIRSAIVEASIVARAPGIWCGGEVALEAVRGVGVQPRVLACAPDGTRLATGDIPWKIAGPAAPLLAAERTVLNFLQRLCGIATRTRRFVDAVADTGTRISDTRKTVPGWRVLDKMAVRAGGGENHRRDLSEVLVKRNHLRMAALDPAAASRRAREVLGPGADFEVETTTLEEAIATAREGARWVMLDNFPLEPARAAIRALHAQFPATLVEISGGITPENVRAYAELKPDRISIGGLTHSAPALDLAMTFVPPPA